MIGEFIPGTGINPRGRYSVHFHRAGIIEVDGTDPNNPILKATKAAMVQDSVVVDSPGWGYVSHTSYVNFDNNIAFNVIGSSFVTEAGNEMGRFSGNLAIKGVGANTSEGIESRKVKQDFGFQGDGFWFQGPAIAVDNNIAVSQRHDGFVFFTVPVIQNYKWADPKSSDPAHPTILSARQGTRLTTTMLAKAYDAALISLLGGAGKSVDPGNIPILSFKNNRALANGVGMETWFHLLGANLPRDLGSQIDGLKVANTRGTGMFAPYTNLTTIKNSLLVGNPHSPGGIGIDRKIANYQSSKDGSNAILLVQHLQTIFFAVKDNAGNSKSFALTIYLDPTAPRVGGNANPTGVVNPSASMIALANQAYVIDLETWQMINLTDPRKK